MIFRDLWTICVLIEHVALLVKFSIRVLIPLVPDWMVETREALDFRLLRRKPDTDATELTCRWTQRMLHPRLSRIVDTRHKEKHNKLLRCTHGCTESP